MDPSDRYSRRLCVSADLRGYGSGDDLVQVEAQRGLLEILCRAANDAGLNRPDWSTSGAADSDFAVLPAGESEIAVVDGYVRAIETGLRQYNELHAERARLRLRLAVHFGPVKPAENGWAGRTTVEVTRLRDCAALRAAMDQEPEAHLGLVLSDTVFRDTVLQGHTTLRPAEFRRVTVRQKEYTGQAWLWLPGADVHRLHLPEQQPGEHPNEPRAKVPDHRAKPQQVNTNYVPGTVSGDNVVFGIQNCRGER